MSSKFLFIIEDTLSHLEPNFKLASTIIGYDNTIDIFFYSKLTFKSLIQKLGFKFLLSETTSPFLRTQAKGFNYIQKLYIQINKNTYYNRKQELRNYLFDIKPSHIILDAFCVSDFVIIKELEFELGIYGIKIFIVQSSFNTNQYYNNFPINSRKIPINKKGLISYLKYEWEWGQFFFKRKIKSIHSFLYYLGFDDLSQFKRKIKEVKKKTNGDFDLNLAKSYFPTFYGIKELFLVPFSLEFSIKNNYCYTGSMLPNYQNRTPYLLEFDKLIFEKIIYISQSTILDINSDEYYANFYLVFIYLTRMLPKYFFVVVIPEKFQTTNLTSFCGENVKLESYVNQPELLSKVDLFISHGGTNSILESIIAKCPILITLNNFDLDQNGNAARIKYHGCGEFIDFYKPLNNWIQLITEIFKNSYYYKLNLESMNNNINLECNSYLNELFN